MLPTQRSTFLAAGACVLLSACTSVEGPPNAVGATSRAESPRVLEGSRPVIVLVSLDGFRWDYPELHGAPMIQRLAHEGVRAKALVPVFPTKTFPNHYSLATGLYAEHHGIVGNNMWDPSWQASFSLGNRAAVESARWWEGEPIWVTAERQGKIAATYFWPGTEAAISGHRPTHWKKFDDNVPGEQRIQEALGWLGLPVAERPTIITLYFSDVDTAGHIYGPEAPETAQAVHRVDSYLAGLVGGIEDLGLEDRVSIVIVSDHGMVGMDPEQVIVLEDYFDLDDARIVDLSCIAMLRPRAGKEKSVYRALHGAHSHLQVFRKREVPDRLHYRSHRRITPIVAWSDPGWYLYATHSERERKRSTFSLGMHGFDNAVPEMGGLFVAWGPAFRSGLEIPAIESVDVYELVARAAHLEPAPNDGVVTRILPALASSEPDPTRHHDH